LSFTKIKDYSQHRQVCQTKPLAWLKSRPTRLKQFSLIKQAHGFKL